MSAQPPRKESDPNPITDPRTVAVAGPPPDGGLVAWTNVACGSIISFVTFGFISSFGELEAYYLTHQLRQYPKSNVAWIAAIQVWGLLAPSMFSGRWFDSYGLRVTVVIGSIASLVSLIGAAFSYAYYQFFLAHLLYGLASSLLFAPSLGLVGQFFAKKRVTAMGIVLAGTGLGGIIYPIAISRLLLEVSFRDTMLIIMGINGVMLLCPMLWMRERLPHRALPPWRTLRKPWSDYRFTLLITGSTIIGFNLFSPLFDIHTYVSSNTSNPQINAYGVTLSQTGTFVGRLIAGFAADRFGVWKVFIIGSFSTALVLFAFWIGPVGSGGTVVGLVLFGAFQGGWITLIAGAMASISPKEELGVRLGLIMLCWAFPAVLGPFFAGLIIDAPGSQGRYIYAGVFAALTWLIGAVLTSLPKVIDYTAKRPRGGAAAI